MYVNSCVQLLQASNDSSPLTEDDTAYGFLFLSITQGSYSLSNIKEVDPLEIGTLLGNIGGMMVPQVKGRLVAGGHKSTRRFVADRWRAP